MSELKSTSTDFWQRLALVLGFVLVVMGLANNLPNIPGLLETVQTIPGLGELPRLSKYNPEYFYPLTFFLMMFISLLGASFAREGFAESNSRGTLGL